MTSIPASIVVAILGAVVPGYNCLIKDNAFFNAGSIAGTIVSSIAITALTGGAGAGLAVAEAAGRVAVEEAVEVAVSAAPRVITTGVEKTAASSIERLGASAGRTSEVEVQEDTHLFRGVPTDHPGYSDAMNGIAKPRGGAATAAEHNYGNTRSDFTSWTTDQDEAAYKAGPGGAILRVPLSSVADRVVESPDLFEESEVLIRGIVTGAEVIP